MGERRGRRGPGRYRLRSYDWREIRQRLGSGESYESIAAAIGCTTRPIEAYVRERGGVDLAKAPWRPNRSRLGISPVRLSPDEREDIAHGIHAGDSFRAIARRLGRAPSTISREVRRNEGRVQYRVHSAWMAAQYRARRPRSPKLIGDPVLRAEVERLLADRWSPQQIARRLRLEYPDDARMRVSHETIYRSLFIQSRGALRHELTACLRTGRTMRRQRGRMTRAGRLKDMVMISERPAEVTDRAVPGHWEGDLLIGRDGRSAIATLVERQTRYVMLVALPDGRTASAVRDALAIRVVTLPDQLRRSLTWDQGKEMADHARFTVDTGVRVYFCDPHSPWQRGSNENTNGLLRQYFPKNFDLSQVDQAELDVVARQLNGRPRQTLNWLKPCEALAKVVASID